MADVAALEADVKSLGAILMGIMGLTSFLFFTVAMVCSFPLAVLAVMHFFGYVWWKAMLAVVIGGFIPVVGQIAYAVFAVLGAYFLIHSGFDWEIASTPGEPLANTDQMTPAQFESYKRSAIRPALKDKCIADLQRSKASVVPARIEAFCECYLGKVFDGLTMTELTAAEMTPERKAIAAKASFACAIE